MMLLETPVRVETPLPHIDFTAIWLGGVQRYHAETGITLPDDQLDDAVSPDATLELIEKRHRGEPTKKRYYSTPKPSEDLLEKVRIGLHHMLEFSCALWKDSSESNPPSWARQFFAAVVFLLDAAKNDESKYKMVANVFDSIHNLTKPSLVYVRNVPKDSIEIEVQEAIAEFVAEQLVFIGFATKMVREGALTPNPFKVVLGDNDFWRLFEYLERFIIRDEKVASTAVLTVSKKGLETLTDIINKNPDETAQRYQFIDIVSDEHNYLRDIGGNLKSGRLYVIGRRASWDDRSNGNIFAWLGAPDPSTTQRLLGSNRAPGTGDWFMAKEEYSQWMAQPNSLMLLHGLYGCGKSYLCTRIVDDLKSKPGGVTYFYFDIYEHSKTTYNNLLAGLIAQLCTDFELTCAPLLQELYAKRDYGKQPPFEEDMIALLKDMALQFENLYVVIDGADDCNLMGAVSALLKTMREWNFGGLHVFVTGDLGPDSYPDLKPLLTHQYGITVEETNSDICLYIDHRTQELVLGKWKEKGPVVMKEVFIGRANGNFQWVHCQMQSIQRARSSINALKTYAREMPDDFDGAYKYLFESINNQVQEDAFRLFPWMAYCLRPLTIREYLSGIEFSVDQDPPIIDYDYRLGDADDGFELFPNLTVKSPDALYKPTHSSIRRALMTGQLIKMGEEYQARMDTVYSNRFISKGCLAYLVQFDNDTVIKESTIDKFPLTIYAAQYWFHHVLAESSIQEDPLVKGLLKSLFTPNSAQLKNWVSLYDLDRGPQQIPLQRGDDFVPNALYYASLLGLKGIVEWLIETGEDVNVSAGFYGNALQVAAVNGHIGVIEILLRAGADVNIIGGFYHTALQAASFAGKKDIVQLLLEKGADVGIEGGYYGVAVKAAEQRRHPEIVELLQNHRAGVKTL